MKSPKEIKSHQSKQPDLCLKQNLRYLAIEIGSRLQKRSFFPATSYKMSQVTILLAATCPGVWQNLPMLQFQSRWGLELWRRHDHNPSPPRPSKQVVTLSQRYHWWKPFQSVSCILAKQKVPQTEVVKRCEQFVNLEKVARNMTMSYYVPFQKSSQWGLCDEMQVGDGSCLVLVVDAASAHRFTITSKRDWSTRPNIIPHFWQNYFGNLWHK